jgi:hypothetical protein
MGTALLGRCDSPSRTGIGIEHRPDQLTIRTHPTQHLNAVSRCFVVGGRRTGGEPIHTSHTRMRDAAGTFAITLTKSSTNAINRSLASLTHRGNAALSLGVDCLDTSAGHLARIALSLGGHRQ